MGFWVVHTPNSKLVLLDVLLKTGSILIRRLYVNQIKNIAQVHKTTFSIRSPNGTNKLPSNYVIVRIKHQKSRKHVDGLFEFGYGALRLVAVDDEELASKAGDAIVSFFQTPLREKEQDIKVELFESKSSRVSTPSSSH